MQEYFIHDNGGRPLKVQVFDRNVLVFKQAATDDEKQSQYNERVLILDNVEHVFIGHDQKTNTQGHSILVKCSKHHYVHISSSSIVSFQTTDEIQEYHAPIGNSDVVYDYAVGSQYMYLLAEYKYFKNEYFDPYYILYGHKVNSKKLQKEIIYKHKY